MAEKQRELTVEERAKAAAEAEKALAEADKARAEAEKARFELQHGLLHSAEQLRVVRAQAEGAELLLASQRRTETDLLAGDKYHHVYYFSSAVESGSVAACLDRLKTWSRTMAGCPMEIVFHSPGGSVIDGLVLFDHIQELRRAGHHITTKAAGWAASMAGILLQAGDVRVMHAEAWVLIHEISFGTWGSMGAVEDTVEWLKRIQDRVLRIFAARCQGAKEAGTAKHPLSLKQLEKGWRRKDWWLSSDQCLDYGLVDEVR